MIVAVFGQARSEDLPIPQGGY